MAPKKVYLDAKGQRVVPTARKAVPSTKPLDWKTAFTLFFAAHLFGALYSPIQDCDEVFNFWEPTHYLNHGYGLQTWEYSPLYAIRSWLYLSIHAIPIYVTSLVPIIYHKALEFYTMRLLFAIGCAMCETRLFSVVSDAMNPRVAILYLLATTTSTGFFHAGTAYLPSSFAMLCVMLALSCFLDWRGGLRSPQGLMWLAVGTIIGWPFIAVLALPFVFEEIVTAQLMDDYAAAGVRLLDGAARSVSVLALEIVVDSLFFRKFTCVPFNIVMYNVFSGPGKGPNIYGTESWHFYIRNLLLNFNIWFLLAAAALPFVLMARSSHTRLPFFRTLVFISPFYLWLGIMTLQPHKEERFMYPIYPCLAFNAALSTHILLSALGHASPGSIGSVIPAWIKLAFAVSLLGSATILGLWRSAGLATAYGAPMTVYSALQTNDDLAARPGDTVCVSKEWYRFPSSYHIPDGTRLKFIKSDFAGLLPGEFSEAPNMAGFGLYPGTWLVPGGFNDENREDPSKYTRIEHCTYLVDVWFEGHGAKGGSKLEPAYIKDEKRWEKVVCEPFLDNDKTGLLGRLGWVPDSQWVPKSLRRVWGEYCLLKQRR